MTHDLSLAQLKAVQDEIEGLQDYFADKDPKRIYRRAFHAKGFCVRAEVRIDASKVPKELQHGIFSKSRVLPAWVRYSNGLGKVQADLSPDVRGFAVKIFADGKEAGFNGAQSRALPSGKPGGKTLDILNTNGAVPTTNTLPALVDFQRDTQAQAFYKLPVTATRFFSGHPTILALLLTRTIPPIRSLAHERFWSGSPYTIGSTHVKYSFTPNHNVNRRNGDPRTIGNNRLLDFSSYTAHIAGASFKKRLQALQKIYSELKKTVKHKDYLSRDIWQRLGERPLEYDLQVQLFKDETLTPLQDLYNEWTEEESKSFTIAKLHIPQQRLDPALQDKCENASFNPGHFVKGHGTPSFLNHGRFHAYHKSASNRYNHNQNPESL
eukprot:TRINITY_DN66208_c11_g4_i2.p1 TRINITY_DN66208_c11_g4~~TRINITY_DN66208_c11_g4_i2.p1  ORF type:complete len:380 (-),score=241.62 TRINITY_DN66208_c11_g4_i2:212-1351(-)